MDLSPLFALPFLPIYGLLLALLLLLVLHDETPDTFGEWARLIGEAVLFIAVLAGGWYLYGQDLLLQLGPMDGEPVTPQSIAALFQRMMAVTIRLRPEARCFWFSNVRSRISPSR